MIQRRMTFALVVGLLCAAGSIPGDIQSLKAFADPCAGSHGAYTDRLCVGDHLAPSEYLISPNRRYRLYYQADGAVILYDTDDPDDWVNTCLMAVSHEDPGKLEYGYRFGDPGAYDINWTVVDDFDNIMEWNAMGAPGRPVGNHAWVLTNSGYMWVYDEEGSINTLHGCYI